MDRKLKYVLTDQTFKINDVTLHRIQAVRTFETIDGKTVKNGDLGGWIQSEANLSQKGKCWVDDEAAVYGKAKIYDDALAYGDVIVKDNTEVYDRAVLADYVIIKDDVKVYGDAKVYGTAEVCGNARVYGNAEVNYDVSKGEISK